MKSYILRVYVAGGPDLSAAAIAGIVEDPDTGRMWRFRDPQELWTIVSRAPPTRRAAWQAGQDGNRSDRKE